MKAKTTNKGEVQPAATVPVRKINTADRPREFKVMCVRECATADTLVDSPPQAAEYWRRNIPVADWFDPAKEAFIVLILNARRHVIGHNLVSLGTLDSCLVHPREVFRPVIVAAGSAIIIMHNHPSGDPTPSDMDVKKTRDIRSAGQLLMINLLDHVVMGSKSQDRDRDYISMRELGHFA